MIDLHTHTTFSDGALIPAELIRRLSVTGHKGVALTDHGDPSNIELIIPSVARACREVGELFGVVALPGIELTHVPPELIADLTRQARQLGAKVIVMHGESPVEPVATGTNRAAIDAGVDILAHPGLITEDDAKLAAKAGVALEVSARKGHSLCNGHVAAMARSAGAMIVINSDGHAPGDLLTTELRYRVGRGAGLTEDEYRRTDEVAENLLERLAKK